MMWLHDDITWCVSECDNTECFRNMVNMSNKERLHSFADFKAEGECPVTETQEDQKGE